MSKRSILLFAVAFITPITITHQTFAACCQATTGNVDGSADGVVDISDVFAMVDYLGSSTPLSKCFDENDVNNDGTIDISDLFAIIDYISGAIPLPPCPTMTDIDGNVYPTVTIGTQVWMAENLKVTHYRNGDAIPNETDGGAWQILNAGAYSNYDNDVADASVYGRLYNWYSVKDSRNIAPTGWHVASDAEWQTLVDYLGGDAVAGGKMKSKTLWSIPNSGATDESGLTTLPSGFRNYGTFVSMHLYAVLWSSTEYNSDYAWYRNLNYDWSGVNRSNDLRKTWGLSVRCVKD